MNSLTLALFLSVVVVASAFPTKQSTSYAYDFNTAYHCSYDSNSNACAAVASLQVQLNQECNVFQYVKVTVNSVTGTVPPNNGIAKCTKRPCSGSSLPVAVDCVEAFGDRLNQIAH